MYVCRWDQVPPWLFTHLVQIVCQTAKQCISVASAIFMDVIEDVGATIVAVPGVPFSCSHSAE